MIMCREEFAKSIDRALFPGIQGGPLMHIIAAKAVAFLEALRPEFRAYQQRLVANAAAMAQRMVELGFRIVSGGTDNHVFLVDVAAAGHTGKLVEKALEKAAVTVNKNTIPFDPKPPLVASGIRIGTPAVTSRGMEETQMVEIADLIARALENPADEEHLAGVKGQVLDLCEEFPLYPPLP
jgi:glycine hydroxymethyltransferase